jgi:hypothetical protein
MLQTPPPGGMASRRTPSGVRLSQKRTARLNMTTKTKLLLSTLGLLAFAASPAMAKTKHVQTYRSQDFRSHAGQASQLRADAAAPLFFGSEGAYAYEPGFRLPTDFQRYNGYQHDRQLVGLGY